MKRKIPPLPPEILLLIARLLGPWDLIHLAQAIPGMERLYKPKYWVPICDAKGNTIFHIASANGKTDIIASLLSKDFDHGIRNSRGYTALHCACQNGQYHVASLLLESDIDLNASAIGGVRALHLAVQGRQVQLVRLLLDKRADLSIPTAANYSILHWSASTRDPDITDMLLKEKVDLTEKDIFGRSPLHWAAAEITLSVVVLLLRAGSNTFCVDHDGRTAAEIAEQQGSSTIAREIRAFQSLKREKYSLQLPLGISTMLLGLAYLYQIGD